MRRLACLIIVLIALSSTVAAAKHPAEGYKANSIEHCYGPERGLPPEWSLGDITFTSGAGRPAAAELTEAEKYMIAGARSSALGTGLAAWSIDIFQVVMRYEAAHGRIPEVLDEQAIRATPGFEDISAAQIEIYRNPLTGAWPRLNARTHSPGDLFLKKLNRAEMKHFAEKSITYQEQWYADRTWRPDQDRHVPSELASPVFYLRMYGHKDILVENFTYINRMFK